MMLMVFITPSMALQQQHSFARFFIDSSAAFADRGLGSGSCGCLVPESNHWSFIGHAPSFVSSLTFEKSVGGTIRYGEALHPGPHMGEMLTVGVSNPTGFRQKEDTLLELGPGVWSLAETQLSAATSKTCSGILRQ